MRCMLLPLMGLATSVLAQTTTDCYRMGNQVHCSTNPQVGAGVGSTFNQQLQNFTDGVAVQQQQEAAANSNAISSIAAGIRERQQRADTLKIAAMIKAGQCDDAKAFAFKKFGNQGLEAVQPHCP